MREADDFNFDGRQSGEYDLETGGIVEPLESGVYDTRKYVQRQLEASEEATTELDNLIELYPVIDADDEEVDELDGLFMSQDPLDRAVNA